MKTALNLAAAAALGLLAVAAAHAQTISVASGINGNEAEEVRLKRSGFAPIEDVAKEKRSVRRATYRDPYELPNAPSVTLEKTADGKYLFTVSGNYGKIQEAGEFTAAEWKDLVKLDPVLAAPKVGRTPIKIEPCFGKFMVVEAAEGGKTRRREVSSCGSDSGSQQMLYAYKVAGIVVNHLDKCDGQADETREPSWVLAECMKPVGRRVGDRCRGGQPAGAAPKAAAEE